jgi:hypothetical protein
MTRIPFKRFILSFLLLNKSISFVVGKLKEFGYFIEDKEVSQIFDELRNTLPPSITDLINAGGVMDIANETHIQWLKHFDILEFYDFILRRDKEQNPPDYFKWCNDCLWAHSYQDVMCLINILLFNEEHIDEISKIVMFKYKKKMGVETLSLYKKMFWDTDCLTAKEALQYCLPFRQNTLIISKLRSGNTEISLMDDSSNNGSDLPVTFHDTNYIKWKVGYREINAPTVRDFVEQVKKDSYFKYYEAMNMTQSIDVEEENGTNDEFGAFDKTLTKKRNTEEQRAKLAKHWLDIFLKANEAVPVGTSETKDFFEKMQQVELDFGEPDDEKIARIEDSPHILADIKGDISP